MGIGARLKMAREAVGLSQRALAAAVGVSATTIRRIENDEAMPDSALLIRLARGCRVKVAQLMRPACELGITNYELRMGHEIHESS